ncbi:MAG: type I pullulanase [Verrucomicrobia bacterium]|nr:type I pullulanase [Verrucomicrobiota bacterium]
MRNISPPAFDSIEFERTFYYDGPLGCDWSKKRSLFHVWSPAAEAMTLRLYRTGHRKETPKDFPMTSLGSGVWHVELPGNHEGMYYTYQPEIPGYPIRETADPYARAVGANGQRAMIVDLSGTDPKGWDKDRKPAFGKPTDAILYELHVRDASIHPKSGIQNKGRFAGLTERGTKGPGGVRTGLDHLVELGVTHVHLLPIADYFTVDETKPKARQYNWGYDPQNYNVPEGSYATDAKDGAVRVREFKSLVQAFHKAGLRVVMDVVYNHTYHAADSCFSILAPGYYYRMLADGSFSNGSGCGNETASERAMFTRFMIDSLVYWAREYHVDGFRFDLMGLHDLETMNLIRAAMDDLDPSILLYGEGWTGGDSPLPESERAIKVNAAQLNRIGVFSDDMRDGVKGAVWDAGRKGFVNGGENYEETIKFGVVAGVRHPSVRYTKVNYSHRPWAKEPHHCVNYCSAHDNHTLWDKLLLTNPEDSEADRIRMHSLSNAIVLTSQGISFLHAGTDFLRTKHGEENSYNKPDKINWMDWSRKADYLAVNQYHRGLIALRKAHPALRLPTAKQIRDSIRFLKPNLPSVVAFLIDGKSVKDPAGRLLVVYNASREAIALPLPEGKWHVLANEKRAGAKPFGKPLTGSAKVAPISLLVLSAKA